LESNELWREKREAIIRQQQTQPPMPPLAENSPELFSEDSRGLQSHISRGDRDEYLVGVGDLSSIISRNRSYPPHDERQDNDVASFSRRTGHRSFVNESSKDVFEGNDGMYNVVIPAVDVKDHSYNLIYFYPDGDERHDYLAKGDVDIDAELVGSLTPTLNTLKCLKPS